MGSKYHAKLGGMSRVLMCISLKVILNEALIKSCITWNVFRIFKPYKDTKTCVMNSIRNSILTYLKK